MITNNHRAFTAPFFPGVFGLQTPANDGAGSLREEALHRDELGAQELPLAELWRALADGKCRIVDGFFSKTRCYLITMPTERQPFDRQSLVILESLLRGSAQKVISLDLNLAPSTIALNARRGLARIGLPEKPTRAHPLLIFAAGAAAEQDESRTGRSGTVIRGNVAFRVVSVARPEACLRKRLPMAELDIVRCLVEGHSHAEMARQRGTSSRTIANQIASVFRRLGVTGRLELVNHLFALSQRDGVDHPAARQGLRGCC